MPLASEVGPAAGPTPSGEVDRRSIGSVGRGTAIMVAGTACLFLFTFASRILLARSISAVAWGEFSLGVAVIGLASVVALLGLDQATARMLSFERDPAARRAIAVKGIVLAASTGGIASLAVFLLAPFLAGVFRAPDYVWLLQLLAFSLGFSVMSLMLAALFQGLEDARPNAVFNQTLAPGLFVGFVALALLVHLGFVWIIAGYVLSNGIAFFAFAIYAIRRLPTHVPRVPGILPKVPQLWTFAAALWGVGTLYYVTAFIDTLILGLYRPIVVVGVYAAGITLTRVLLVGNNALTFIYLPVAARLARDREHATIRTTYLVGTRWIVLLTMPAALVFCLLPGQSLAAIFGPGFGSGAPALSVLAAAAFLSIVLGPANASLAGLGETRWLLLSTVVSGTVNVALSVVWIPSFGLLGAAAAWSVARIAYPSVAALRLHRAYRVSAGHGALLKPVAWTLALAGPLDAAWALHGAPPWSIFPLYLAGLTIFVVGLVATRSLLPGDTLAVRSVAAIVRRTLPRTTDRLARRFGGLFPHLPPPERGRGRLPPSTARPDRSWPRRVEGAAGGHGRGSGSPIGGALRGRSPPARSVEAPRAGAERGEDAATDRVGRTRGSSSPRDSDPRCRIGSPERSRRRPAGVPTGSAGRP